jgi:hypothetical protein
MNNIPTVIIAQGLCNRIKTYMTALCEYDKVNTQVFADNYIFPSIEYDANPTNKMCGWRLEVLPEEEDCIEKYNSIDLLYHDTPQYFIEKYLNALDKIKINPDILEYTNSFLEDWDDVIGVHIRSWYHAGSPRFYWHDNQLFENEIDKFDSSKKIFLCSDNNDVIQYFKQKYGDRIITHDQIMHQQKCDIFGFHHDDVQLVTDGFIDCLLLSKCKTIIGTWASTFAEVAWWLGRCKSTVIIPKPKNVTLQDENDFFTLKSTNG